MGSAIARGLVQGSVFRPGDITVVDISEAPLKALRDFNPVIRTALNKYDSVENADLIILAVKPWLVKETIANIRSGLDYSKQIVVSIAAGVSIRDLGEMLHKPDSEAALPALFRVIPNTAISIRQSVNLVATENASPEQKQLILKIFGELGYATLLDESKLNAGTALASCGIAYLFRYVRAAVLAGVEMGFYPKEAQTLVVKTMLGAASLLDETQENPEAEIDKVTTPGGITIKGLNELETHGFSAAIIKAMKASR